jgi:3-carboxy-cis,cis-muconate cycloisomerase
MLMLGDVIGRQRAHDVVSDAARVVGRDGRRFADALTADPRVRAHLDAAAITALLDPPRHTGRCIDKAHDGAQRARVLVAELRR